MPGCPCRRGAPIAGHHPKCPLHVEPPHQGSGGQRDHQRVTVAQARRVWDKMQEDGDALDLDSFYEILKEVFSE